MRCLPRSHYTGSLVCTLPGDGGWLHSWCRLRQPRQHIGTPPRKTRTPKAMCDKVKFLATSCADGAMSCRKQRHERSLYALARWPRQPKPQSQPSERAGAPEVSVPHTLAADETLMTCISMAPRTICACLAYAACPEQKRARRSHPGDMFIIKLTWGWPFTLGCCAGVAPRAPSRALHSKRMGHSLQTTKPLQNRPEDQMCCSPRCATCPCRNLSRS